MIFPRRLYAGCHLCHLTRTKGLADRLLQWHGVRNFRRSEAAPRGIFSTSVFSPNAYECILQTRREVVTTNIPLLTARWGGTVGRRTIVAFSRPGVLPDALRDLINTGSLYPPNPVLAHLDDFMSSISSSRGTRGANDSPSMDSGGDAKQISTLSFPLPPFAIIEPRHFITAVAHITEEYDAKMTGLKEKYGLNMAEKQEASLEYDYESIMLEIDNIQYPLRYVKRLLDLLESVGLEEGDKRDLDEAYLIIKEHNLKMGDDFTIFHEIFETLSNQANAALSKAENQSQSLEKKASLLLWTERKRVLDDIVSKFRLQQEAIRSGEADNEEAFKKYMRAKADMESFFSSRNISINNKGSKRIPASKNIQLMYGILSYKNRLARMAGYDDYASFCLQAIPSYRMATNVAQITDLHESVFQGVEPVAHAVATGRVRAHDPGLDGFFVLSDVLREMFGLAHRLFGVRFTEATTDEYEGMQLWNRDIRLFHAHDDDDEETSQKYLGSFLLDPYSRPYKEGGEWTGVLFDRRGSIGKSNNIAPLIYVGTQFNPPVWEDSPVRMSFGSVKSLFHEFGHVLHHMLADVEFGFLSGPEAVEEDAVEFPSQFMEYWLYEESVLKPMLGGDVDYDENGEGGGYFSKEALRSLRALRGHESAMKYSMQIFMGQLEVDLHSVNKFNPDGDDSILALHNNLASKYIPHEKPERGDLSKLTTLFQFNADGHDMSSYRYMWSNVMAADAFEAFFVKNGDDSVDPEEHQAKVGRALRRTVLEVGGRVPMAEAFRKFRGRDPDVDCLLRCHDWKK